MANTTERLRKYTERSTEPDLNSDEPEVLYPEGTLFTNDPNLEMELDRFGYPADVINDPDLADVPLWRRRKMAEFRAESIAEADAADEAADAYIKERNEEKKLRRADRRDALGIKWQPSGIERGFRYERIMVVRRDWKNGPRGKYHDGYWLCKCDCGAIVRLSTQELRQKMRKARACGACLARYYPPRSLRDGKVFGRPRKNWKDMVFGRLTVGEYFDCLGWLCTCETCGGQEICVNKNEIVLKGSRGCSGDCAPI